MEHCESERCLVVSDSLRPHGLYSPWILQARTLEWVAFPFSSESSWLRDQTQVSCIAGGFFTKWANWGSPQYWLTELKNSDDGTSLMMAVAWDLAEPRGSSQSSCSLSMAHLLHLWLVSFWKRGCSLAPGLYSASLTTPLERVFLSSNFRECPSPNSHSLKSRERPKSEPVLEARWRGWLTGQPGEWAQPPKMGGLVSPCKGGLHSLWKKGQESGINRWGRVGWVGEGQTTEQPGQEGSRKRDNFGDFLAEPRTL